jgi:hypothetical protein
MKQNSDPISRPDARNLAEKESHRRLVAPLWHTALLIAILVLLVVGGARLQGHAKPGDLIAPEHTGTVSLYLSVIVLEWGLVWFVWFGLRRGGTRLRELIGGRWNNGRAVLFDVGVAFGFWIVWEGVGKLMHLLLGPSHAKTIDALLPQGAFEILLWIAVSMSAGFGEEVVYRGYLQKQILALSGSVTAAVLGQAGLFGLSHAYQGAKQVVVITALGPFTVCYRFGEKAYDPTSSPMLGRTFLVGCFLDRASLNAPTSYFDTRSIEAGRFASVVRPSVPAV